jgi:hypothetical protein
MSKNQLSRDEIRCWVQKLKHELYSEQPNNYIKDPKQIAHRYLERVLNKIDEYRY